jgi:hypothetical protein
VLGPGSVAGRPVDQGVVEVAEEDGGKHDPVIMDGGTPAFAAAVSARSLDGDPTPGEPSTGVSTGCAGIGTGTRGTSRRP